MKIRRVTSLTASLALVLMILTSIILYIVPEGRVAYWAEWRLWGLSKTEWGNIHINMGLLFLISMFLHIYYNWKTLISYLKNKAKQVKIFTPELCAALALAIVFIIGTYFLLPPFSWTMSLNDYFKDTGAAKYGEPPYGHAELSSLRTFTQRMNLDLEKSMQLLNQAGYRVEDSAVTLAAIARQHNISPQVVYEAMKSAAIIPDPRSEANGVLPELPQPGIGKLTLADFCAQFKLNPKRVVRELKQQGIEASEELTFKKIAADNKTSPSELYERIKSIVQN